MPERSDSVLPVRQASAPPAGESPRGASPREGGGALPDAPSLDRTVSGIVVKEVYGPGDLDGVDLTGALGEPGAFPFTRGKFPRMYRDRLWITRNLCGMHSPQRTNERLRFLLSQGQTGIALVPDTPTQLGIDGDHPLGRDGVGVQGVPISSLADMRALFDGLPIERLTASFSVPGVSAAPIIAQYAAAARERGIDAATVRGSVQNDPIQAALTSYDPRNPLEMTMRVMADAVEFCAREMPAFHCITVNAYDLRETGLDAVQEVAFTLAIAKEYVERIRSKGLETDEFAHRILVISGAHSDLFEEAAKYRAMRRMWARMMRELGARDERTQALTLAVHTSGTTLTAEQPINNVVRGTVQALSAILGGCQALDLSCYDEASSLPSELAGAVAIRTQQVLAYESGAARTADPLGGSYYVESLTNEIEERALAVMAEIGERGGMVAAVESGWAEAQIKDSLALLRDRISSGDYPVVGKNIFREGGELDDALPLEDVHLEVSEQQVAAVREHKRSRDQGAVRRALAALLAAAGDRDLSLMPTLYESGVAGATLGEIIGTIRRAYGLPYDPFGLLEDPLGL